MAEDVNFPLDQTRNTSTVEFVREALRESGRPKGIEGQEKELNNPDRFREQQKQQPVNDLGSLESRVELFQGVRQQSGENLRNLNDLRSQEAKQDIAEAERRELQASRELVDPDRIEAFENVIRIDVGSLESRVELFQGARPQAGENLRNPTDASALETERGQNISSLI